MAAETVTTKDVATDGQGAMPSARVRWFPMSLVVVATFPLALGLGFALQAVPTPPGKLSAAQSGQPPVPNDIQPRVVPKPQRSDGDLLFRDGRFEAALHLYRSLGSADSLRVPPELAIRIAICQEKLGWWDDALATFRSVSASSDPRAAHVSILGQARIWIRLGDFDAAEGLLRSLFINAGSRPELSPEACRDAAVMYSIVLAQLSRQPEYRSAVAGLTPVGNQFDWYLDDDLTAADGNAPVQEIAVEESLRVTPLRQTVTRPELLDDGHDRDRNPLAIPVTAVAHQQPLDRVLEELATQCDACVELTESMRERIAARVINVNAADVPMGVLLAAICHDVGAVWEYQSASSSIVIAGVDERTDGRASRRANASQVLRLVVDTYPHHRLTPSARFASAELLEADGRYADAAAAYSRLTGRTITPLAIHSSFNAALTWYRIGDPVRACKSLEVIVHGAPGHELHTRSMILYGRVLIDRGEFGEAAFQLKRAAASRHSAEDEARAAVFLAMAELLDNKPMNAAESLFAHRFQFQDRSVRNAAALMNSLARWKTLNGTAREREAAYLFRSIAASESDSEWLGPPGLFLLGQAMIEADLASQMETVYTRSLEQGASGVITTQMRLALADYWYSQNRVTEAKAVWADVYSKDSPQASQAGVRLASAALDERQFQHCLELCQALQNQDNVPKADLLKLAGRAYEKAGQPLQAAQCYAGHWPSP